MQKPYIIKVMKSRYCELTFMLALAVSWLLLPENIFYGWYYLLAASFMILFALVLTCTVRNIKERIGMEKTYSGSLIGMVASVLGISALSVCGIGAPVCGATIGIGLASLLIPGIAMPFLNDYGMYIIAASLVIQLASLHFLNCFRKVNA